MERISATLPDGLDAEWRRFHRGGGSGTAFVAMLAERAERAGRVPGLEAEIARLRAAPDVQAARAAAAREAADFRAEAEAHDRERAAWAVDQAQADADLAAAAQEQARLQAEVDLLRELKPALLAAFAASAADAARSEIERRAEDRSWVHVVTQLDDPQILERVLAVAAATGRLDPYVNQRALDLMRQHLAAAEKESADGRRAADLEAARARYRASRRGVG